MEGPGANEDRNQGLFALRPWHGQLQEVGPDFIRCGIWTKGTDLCSNKKNFYIFTLNEIQNFNRCVYLNCKIENFQK